MLNQRQRIAVIGSGISGLASAYFLNRGHEVTLFEAGNYLGGHTHTVDVTLDGVTHPADTGFLVFNQHTYPNLIALFAELAVSSHATDMSFGVSMDQGHLEWAGTNLDTVFAQRRNMLSPRFLGMLRDILRFNAAAAQNLSDSLVSGMTLGQLLDAGRYGETFRHAYLLPMAAAIWSSSPRDILAFPASTFLRFCINHALLQVNNRPQWQTVQMGAREYVKKIAATLPDIRLNTPVVSVDRQAGQVRVRTATTTELFDAVVMATHAPDTLQMLGDASAAEAAVLGAVKYQPNLAVLHTDSQQLPKRRKVWSAWNYLGGAEVAGERPVCVSYLLNQLQQLPFAQPVVVTLNPFTPPDPARVIARFEYAHPVFDQAAIDAQQQLPTIQGKHGIWFAGAWTGYGFHEDGLKSALRVVADFGMAPEWARV
ncbi:NAD(P)/FAD-dependent oxidoreductase [Leeia oryzae]|uniref:NAD(P)/FAD-dependent oxidoreductase n=1 Tax=Leeia oryzae TaxID=356662 RepID=UPI000374021F|nr:FAD-dependent oxidoreductase [Leeia oryzae]